ncbi:branched-chain amino acid ABC transporter permease [Falsirhodobacter algicola]|uniref:Branched-chain amino acid ABC transporter permease n=1 Tax=Falsirhodobacter algicola TaxID=2692330 RepID=A0A8J8MRZ0_9RHOB|nr:branched-chain amino acid ABC transporter permease [Falsirhodobacter algicola]QUS35286.1 branched-chain amino acid ABC transporter permease [Falsirhodobacter algicola]
MDAYLVAILTTAAVYVILAMALNIQFGLTGLMNFGVVGFYGVGAYTSGIVTETLGQPILIGMAAALAVGGIAGALVSLLSVRLSGDFLAIVTLGFAETMRLVFNNEDWLTRGPRGFLIMTRPVIDGLGREASAWFILGVFVLVAVLAFVLLNRLAGAPFGRVLRSIREDDLVPATLGKNVLAYRVQAFMLGSAVMALAGSLYAHYVQTITPDNFTTQIAVLVWMSLIVGGAGNMKGAVLGALVVTAIYEGTRFLAPLLDFLTPTQISALRFIIIGTLLIAVVRFRPEGLLPERTRRPRQAA